MQEAKDFDVLTLFYFLTDVTLSYNIKLRQILRVDCSYFTLRY